MRLFGQVAVEAAGIESMEAPTETFQKMNSGIFLTEVLDGYESTEDTDEVKPKRGGVGIEVWGDEGWDGDVHPVPFRCLFKID